MTACALRACADASPMATPPQQPADTGCSTAASKSVANRISALYSGGVVVLLLVHRRSTSPDYTVNPRRSVMPRPGKEAPALNKASHQRTKPGELCSWHSVNLGSRETCSDQILSGRDA